MRGPFSNVKSDLDTFSFKEILAGYTQRHDICPMSYYGYYPDKWRRQGEITKCVTRF
jgi:hypothetical protein